MKNILLGSLFALGFSLAGSVAKAADTVDLTQLTLVEEQATGALSMQANNHNGHHGGHGGHHNNHHGHHNNHHGHHNNHHGHHGHSHHFMGSASVLSTEAMPTPKVALN